MPVKKLTPPRDAPRIAKKLASASDVSRVAKKVVRRRAARPEPVILHEPASIEQSEKTFGVDARRSREICRLVDQVVA